jgi:plasmid stability protein
LIAKVVHLSQLIVRNVDPGIVKALKRRAVRHGRSAEAEHREILRAALGEEATGGSFKVLLGSMPDVGTDEDFLAPRDLPRDLPRLLPRLQPGDRR